MEKLSHINQIQFLTVDNLSTNVLIGLAVSVTHSGMPADYVVYGTRYNHTLYAYYSVPIVQSLIAFVINLF